MPLFLAFLIVPLIEIGLFIQVGGVIGLWPTLAIVVATALAGSMLMRAQGAGAILRVQEAMARGEDPGRILVHGALILFAGALLLTPGFFTDAVGLALLVPALRERAIDAGGAWLARRMAAQMAARGQGHAGGQRPGRRPAPDIIEADYTVIDRTPGEGDERQGRGPSPWQDR